MLQHSYLSISKPFVVKVFFYINFGSINLWRSYLNSFYKFNFLLYVILLTFLYSSIPNISNTWSVCKFYFKPNTISFYLILQYFNIREESLAPKSFKRICDIFSGYLYLLTFS